MLQRNTLCVDIPISLLQSRDSLTTPTVSRHEISNNERNYYVDIGSVVETRDGSDAVMGNTQQSTVDVNTQLLLIGRDVYLYQINPTQQQRTVTNGLLLNEFVVIFSNNRFQRKNQQRTTFLFFR